MKILIADDSQTERMLLRHILRKWGFTVVEADNGRAALETLADSDIQLAILDWMMPQMDGLEVCNRIHDLKHFVYAILVTGVGKEEDIAHALDKGASDYIVKPFDVNQLRARLRVGERITNLQRQLTHLQKMESMGRMSEGLAHELNTPAQYLGDNLRYLRDAFADLSGLLRHVDSVLGPGADATLPSEALHSLRDATAAADLPFLLGDIPNAIQQSIEGVEQVATIVASMKQFARPGTEELRETDLGQVIEDILAVNRAQWQDVAEVETDFDPNLDAVSCFTGDFRQIVLHLLTNAAHAVKEAMREEPGRKGLITIKTRNCGASAELRITDTGTGIPEQTRTRIFDPFFTTKPVGCGIGQGLCIVHRAVVDRHHGTIAVESELGTGTTVTVHLPLHPESDAQRNHSTTLAGVSRKEKKDTLPSTGNGDRGLLVQAAFE